MLIDCPAGNSHKNWEPEELKTASSILNPMNKLNNDDDDDNDHDDVKVKLTTDNMH